MKYEHQLLPIDIEYHVKDIGSAFAIQQDEPSSTMIDHMVANSGVREIAELVKAELNIKSPFFIEYSLIHSVLSPQARNRLTTFLYGEGEITFLENIKKFYSSIVAASAYKGVTVYQHPDVFINPSKGEIAFSISRMIGEAKEHVQFIEKPLTSLIIDKTSVYGYSEFHREYEEMLSVAERSRKDNISLNVLQRRLQELLHALLLKGTNQSTYITIPIAGAEYDSSAGELGFRRSKCHGVIFIYVANYLIEDDAIHKPLKRLHKKVSNFVRYSSCNYLFNLGMSLLSSVRYYSMSAAIGSIMSRNGSHNIGSHVLSALSHNVGTMPDDRVLYQYIQYRMDYIASATTGAPDWSVPTPFVGNLMKMFYSQRHLLEHIAESDGLHAYQYQGKGAQIGSEQTNCVKIVVRRISHSTRESWTKKRVFSKDVWVYDFFGDDVDRQVEWEYDEAVSVPGGILGQHAFYNIVENVLRNAAKHSWAGKKPGSRGVDNLEIYVDFEKNQPDENGMTDGMMCFTVGDNMSRLFPEKFWNDCFSYLDTSNNTIPLPNDCTCWAEVFALPLDSFYVPIEGEISNRQRIEEFLNGKVSSEVLPPQYKALYEYVKCKWDDLTKNSSFMESLKGFPDKKENGDPDDSKPGHRLPLPLHHRQEIVLAEPFINLKTNRLRQSSWGLSEMKISAGYLRRADVSVIGGLKHPKSGEHPLIVPLGVPRSGQDEAKWEELCLAYRFWVKLPKDVLIVADDTGKWGGITGDEWEGIGVKSYTDVFEKNHIGLMSDYRFVIIDHHDGLNDDVRLKLPFRYLVVDGDETQATVARKDLEQAATAKDLVMCVYRGWLDYLKRRRGVDAKRTLKIKLNIYDEKGSEKGLISDRDIYKVLFRECFHSILEPITSDVKLPALQRKALLLVSLYPVDEDDPLFKEVDERVRGLHLSKMKRLLGEISGKVWRFWSSLPCASEKDCDKWNPLVEVYKEGLKRAENSMRYKEIPKALLDELCSFQRHAQYSGDSALLQELKLMSDDPSGANIVKLAASALDVARTTSDVFLRKYEERIVTLPQQYKSMAKPKKTHLEFKAFGVDVAYGATNESCNPVDISYNRHSVDGSPLYSEPLSGSQTYLNALSDLSDGDAQWAMRLEENGLLRIVIIDERVRAFIKEHGDEIRKTYESMRIAVVDTEKPPLFDPQGTELPDFRDWNYVAGGSHVCDTEINSGEQTSDGLPHETGEDGPCFDPDFDLIVIHQGIIDKWWPDHGKKKVSEILEELRKRKNIGEGEPQNRFVVVTTGRGRPDNIPDNEKVLAFSVIEAFLFKRYPEKLNLVNSLMNILPGSPERNDYND